MKTIRFFLLLSFVFLCDTLIAQQTRKVKFKDQNGNVIFYHAVPNTDDVRYCDLYFIPRNSSIARKITIKKYKIDESELGETCIPTIISINNVDYQYSNYNWGDYLILKSTEGKIIRFNSIN